jgi:macrodomain Ter protein organizer (MatP/YcbG family)
MGHFVNRNANGLQFNKPAVLNTVKKGMDAYSTARYFSHAGFGEAIRYTLGMQPTPSHMNDWIRARHNTDVIDKRPPALHVEQANLSW